MLASEAEPSWLETWSWYVGASVVEESRGVNDGAAVGM